MSNDRKPAIYFVIIALACLCILVTGPLLTLNLPFLLTQIFAILLIFWSWLSFRMNKHTGEPHKLPKGNFFVTKGPYEIIRHPIYGGLLLLMTGFVQGDFTPVRFAAFIVLLFVVLIKITYDENLMHHYVKEYNHYQEKNT